MTDSDQPEDKIRTGLTQLRERRQPEDLKKLLSSPSAFVRHYLGDIEAARSARVKWKEIAEFLENEGLRWADGDKRVSVDQLRALVTRIRKSVSGRTAKPAAPLPAGLARNEVPLHQAAAPTVTPAGETRSPATAAPAGPNTLLNALLQPKPQDQLDKTETVHPGAADLRRQIYGDEK